MGGVNIRQALFAAGIHLGGPCPVTWTAPCPAATGQAYQAQFRITYRTRDDIPTLMQNAAWLAQDPRYSAGSYSTRIWYQRWSTAVNAAGSYGNWCQVATLTVPATLGTSQTFGIALPGGLGPDDMLVVEARAGLSWEVEVNVTAGGPWYKVGGGQIGHTNVGVANAASAFHVLPYACQ